MVFWTNGHKNVPNILAGQKLQNYSTTLVKQLVDKRKMSQDLSGGEDTGHVSLSDNENPRSDTEKDVDPDLETGKGEIVDPTKKRVIRNPQPKLNAERLRSKKGVHTIEQYFQGFKWRGKGHEASDLNKVMKRLEHWGHRLYPKYNFDDLLEKIGILGSKKEVQTFLIKYRKDMLTDDLIEEKNPDEDNDIERGRSPEPVDEFDLLIAEQIEKTKQITTPMRENENMNQSVKKIPNTPPAVIMIDEEMKKKIERNRQIALEKRMARQNAAKEAEASLNKERETSTILQELSNQNEILEEAGAVDHSRQSSELSFSIEDNRQVDMKESLGKVEGSQETEDRNQIDTHENSFGENDDATLLLEDNVEHVEESSMELNSHDREQQVDHDEKSAPSSTSHLENTPKKLNATSGKRLLTNEELDKEIDDAVNQFMKRKRQSK